MDANSLWFSYYGLIRISLQAFVFLEITSDKLHAFAQRQYTNAFTNIGKYGLIGDKIHQYTIKK